jgi:acetyl-CoA C-acetyltransferase
VGTGQTKGRRRREDVNLSGLIHEAVRAALEDADLKPSDVDAVVIGNAPEVFEGINYPELLLGTASAGFMKPVMRIYTGGSVGASVGICAYYHVACGLHDVVLAVAFEKLSDGVPNYGLSVTYDPLWGRDFAAGAVTLVALQAREYMHRNPQITEEHFAMIAVKTRKDAQDNPYAHLQLELTVEEALSSHVVVSPLRLHDCCPTTDAAAAAVFASGDKAKRITDRPAWVKSIATCSEGAYYPGMDMVYPVSLQRAAQTAYKRAGITDPVKEIDVAELYCAFTPQEMIWAETVGLCERGKGGEMTESGRSRRDGEMPLNPSGTVVSNNPIGASALIRQIEAALQVSGKAGAHQVDGVKTALAHGWGGWLQFHTIMILSSEL